MTRWGICTIVPTDVLQWIECHPGLAGYLQAIGGVLAVLVAVFAPQIAARFQQKQAQAEASQQTHLWVRALDAAMPGVVEKCGELSFKVASKRTPPIGADSWSQWFDSVSYVMPYELANAELMSRSFDPAKVGAYVVAAQAIIKYNNLRNKIQFAAPKPDENSWQAVTVQLLEALNAASDAAAVAYGSNDPKWRWRFWRRRVPRKLLRSSW